MKITEIKNAIELINNHMTKMNDMYENVHLIKNALCVAIDCMQNELERLENKPLDLEQLKNMIGEPVWSKKDGDYILIFALECQDNGETVKWYIEYTLPNASKKRVRLQNESFLKYKPQEVQDD